MPRDSQRSKVYKWQNILRERYSEYMYKVLTTEQAEELIARIHRSHGLPAPKVTVKKTRNSFYRHGSLWSKPEIVLATSWGRQGCTVIHEAAHGIANYYAPNEAGHGPTFVRVLMDLHRKYFKIPLSEQLQVARMLRMKVARPIEYKIVEVNRGVIPKVKPVVQAAPKKRGRPKKATPTPVVQPKGLPMRAASAEPTEIWIRCAKCKKMLQFKTQPIGFQYCKKCS